jgi:adenylate cyclase
MMRPMTRLSMRELAERSGVNLQRLRQLINLGILSPDAAGRFQPADIQRVRIIQAMDGAGIAPAQIGQLIATGAYSLGWAQVLFPDPTPQVTTTLQQAAVESGLPRSLIAGLYAAWELARPEPEQPLRADDAELLRLAVLGYLAFGRDKTVTLGIARQLGESLRRLAESQIRLFRTRIQEPLAAADPSERRVRADAITAAAAPLLPALERTVLLLYRRYLEHYVIESIVLNTETSLEQAGLGQRRPVRPPAIAFLDLTGYTTLTEERGDRAAADLAARLVELVSTVAHQHGGRPVKLLGDGVMFYFPEPAQAVVAGLELVQRIPDQGLPRARVGVNSGPVVFQDGDYFGRTVNVAARITDYARPGEVLVSDSVVTATNGPRGVRYQPIGPIALKGVTTPVTLHAAVPTQ